MKKSKTVMKRLFVLLISIVMVMGMMTTTAFAKDGQATITINRPSGMDTSLSNMQVHAYMVLDQVNDEEQTAAKKQYSVTTAFEGFFNMTEANKNLFDGTPGGTVYLGYNEEDGYMTYSDTSDTGTIAISAAKLDLNYPEADLVSRIEQTEQNENDITANNGDIATFYTWIEKYIEATEPAADNSTPANGGSSIVFSDLNEGYYALTFSNVPIGISVKQGILVATPETVELKAEEIPFIKQVKNPQHSGENFNNNTPLKETSADVGETLDYQLYALIPTLTDTTNLTEFKMTDTLTNQKLTGTMTLELKKAGQETLEYTAQLPTIPEDESANIEPAYFTDASGNKIAVLTIGRYLSNDKTQSFTVDFLPTDSTQKQEINDVLTNHQGYDVTLVYHAEVTADAVRINGNEAKLYINNNDNTTEDTDETKVYTYGIEVQKKFSDQRETDPDVTFQLRTSKDDEATAIHMGEANGVYYVDANGDSNLKLDEDGKINIKGLDAGTYWLVETAAPDGFTVARPVEIVLTEDPDSEGDLDTVNSTAKFDGTDPVADAQVDNTDSLTVSLVKFTVLNQKGFDLPQTGGAGTWMLTIGGIVLIAAAAGVFVTFRRKTTK